MRAVVLGGAGFLGSHLCDALVTRGDEVICIDNEVTGGRENVRHLEDRGLSFLHADIVAGIVVDGVVDAVFHLASAASPPDYQRIPIATLRAGSEGTLHALELAAHKKARFLVTSTSEVYGDPAIHPQPESYWGNVNPVGLRSCYDEAKRFSEALTVAYQRERGLCVQIARIFNTYGPRMRLDDGRVLPNFVGQALRGEPLTIFGDGTQTRSFCYVDDLIRGFLLLIEKGDGMPVNLGNPTELTMIEFANAVQRVAGTKLPLERKPLPPDDPKRRRPDISRAKKLLGWEPMVSLEDGLKKTVAFYRSSGDRSS